MASLDLELNGKSVQPPKDWRGVKVLMTWDNGSRQANITTENFTLVGDSARDFMQWINDGLNGDGNGYFQGMPARFSISEGGSSEVVFDGFTDNKTFVDLTPNDTNEAYTAQVGFRQNDQLINFRSRAEGVTFDVVRKEGFLPDSVLFDLLYVRQKPFDITEAFAVSYQITILTLNLISTVKSASSLVINSVAHATGGFTGPIAGAVFASASLVIEVVSIVANLVALVLQVNTLFKIFLPMPRKAKVCSLFDLSSAVCNYLGYEFQSSMKELKEWYILPSFKEDVDNNPFSNAVFDTGYFSADDTGYIAGEFFKALESIAGGKFQINGTTANFENLLNDDFWLNSSTANFRLPDTFIHKQRPNGEEINATTFVSFKNDPLDEWTREDSRGYDATAVVEHLTAGDKLQDLLTGLNRIQIPYSLGTQKETENAIEKARKNFSNMLNSIGRLFGRSPSSLNEAFNHIKECLKISGDFTSVPKLLSLKDAVVENKPFKLLSNNSRSTLNAKKILELNGDLSPVSNNYRNQWRIFDDVSIPFGFTNFKELIGNNYFLDQDDNAVRMDAVEWEFGSDSAEATYRVRKPYDKNLKETIFVPNK